MSAGASLALPATHEERPEYRRPVRGPIETLLLAGVGRLARYWRTWSGRLLLVPWWVGRHERGLQSLSLTELTGQINRLKGELRRRGLVRPLVARSFAMIREVARRTMGQRHHDCQLKGGWVLLSGMVAEMDTGEGKTLTATLAAGTAAMAGLPVHVITVNDYLTERDAEEMGAIYKALGLSVGTVIHGRSPQERRAAYACDITYATNKEIVFDYLRDQIKLGQQSHPVILKAEYLHKDRCRSDELLLRGLHFGIVDEADSILIDEARTPLIISSSVGGSEEENFLRQVTQVAASLERDKHYLMEDSGRMVILSEEGRTRLADEARVLGSLWSGSVRREDTVRQALVARHGFHKDVHYVVIEGKIQIVDEYTGRIMADRSWERGLHQLIEIKEGCEPTNRREPIARISYQRFFRRYLHLSGMTGTAREVQGELWSVYDLATVRLPTHRRSRRAILPDRIFRTNDEKVRAVVARVREIHEAGRPILIGTRSVAASESLGEQFRLVGMDHQVLNAKRDKEESQIVALAGEGGRVTIATNMAGRGTDIKLSPEVRGKGGLHVILTERHDAARIDRQLAGRCGRQGDPGSVEAFLSLEDQLLEDAHMGHLVTVVRSWMTLRWPGGRFAARRLFRWAQSFIERVHARIRKNLLVQDERLKQLISFSGRLE